MDIFKQRGIAGPISTRRPINNRGHKVAWAMEARSLFVEWVEKSDRLAVEPVFSALKYLWYNKDPVEARRVFFARERN